MAEVLRGFNNLQCELEKAKENLKDVDENIKRLTGRDPSEGRLGPRRPPAGFQNEFRGRERFIPPGSRRELPPGDGLPPPKRRGFIGGPFGRLGARPDVQRRLRDEDSGDEDDYPHKPTLQSSVVPALKEQKTRKDCIDEQKTDERGLARNKRMFGLLLGTLQKFKVEEQQKKDKELKRQEIERKLEAQVEKEKEELKRERQQLFLERRRRQADLRRLEHKMELVKQQETWEVYHRHLLNFIRTKVKPHLFYLPARHNKNSEQRLHDSQQEIEAMIAAKRASVEEEISHIDRRRELVIEQQEHMEIEPNEEDDETEDKGNVLPEIGIDEEPEEGEYLDDEIGGDGKENIPTSPGELKIGRIPSDGHLSGIFPEDGLMVKRDKGESDLKSRNEEGEGADHDIELEKFTVEVLDSTNLIVESEDMETDKKDQQQLLNEKEFEPIYD